jgi:hypothetical protein
LVDKLGKSTNFSLTVVGRRGFGKGGLGNRPSNTQGFAISSLQQHTDFPNIAGRQSRVVRSRLDDRSEGYIDRGLFREIRKEAVELRCDGPFERGLKALADDLFDLLGCRLRYFRLKGVHDRIEDLSQ